MDGTLGGCGFSWCAVFGFSFDGGLWVGGCVGRVVWLLHVAHLPLIAAPVLLVFAGAISVISYVAVLHGALLHVTGFTCGWNARCGGCFRGVWLLGVAR